MASHSEAYGRLTRYRLFIVLFMLCTCCGCGGDEEEEHLEHIIPAHKPRNFAEAVSELQSRGVSIWDETASAEMKDEMLDIINWLPELAADSDLRRKQWETVQSTSQELSRIATSQDSEKSVESWNSYLEELESLVPYSDLAHPGANLRQVQHTETSEPTSAGEQQHD
ncbi:hypothetical protein [Thalassoglobus neptunius]|nr:hypothetical protein [Thalassoglobus neptunius]